MLNIAIVDDLREDRERLRADVGAYFARSHAEAACRAYPDAASFLRAHGEAPFQLAFLDICMAETDGIALSRMLRQTDAGLLIVFVSTSREYAFDAFPAHPFDYLVKPYARERLNAVLDEALRALGASDKTIVLRVPHASLSVQVGQISAVLARDHAVEVVLTTGRRLRSIATFTELSGQLEGEDRFLLLNRGVLVNMDDVLTLQDDSMRMKSGDVYPLRTRGRGAVISAFTQYQIARMRKERRP